MERIHPNPTIRLLVYVLVGVMVFVGLALATDTPIFAGAAIGIGGSLLFTYFADPTNPHTRHPRR